MQRLEATSMRRNSLPIASLCLLLATANLCQGTEQAKPAPSPPRNVVLILADDMRWDTIHALGNPEIHTPTLDRLVERGFKFNNAFCMGSMVGAVCLPSRTMLITGRSLWRIPANPRAKVAPKGVPLLPTLLNDAGYATFHCGKAGNSCTFGNAAFQTNIETKQRTAESATEHANEVIGFLKKQDATKPFFVYLAPPVPHDPRLSPPEFAKLYDPAKISLSKNFMTEHPFDNGELLIRDEVLAPIPRTTSRMKQELAEYYATISHLDNEVGRIVKALEEKDLLNNTVIIFSSDQGLAVGGRHGLMGKQNLYEHVKPPLIVAGPGIPHGESNALTYLYDLFPTICDLAEVKVPAVIEGKSLVPVLEGRQPRVRDSLLGAYTNCQRMIRDERWKLIKYNAKGVINHQMFDLKNDSDEIHNLYDDPKYRAERDRLEALMTESRKQFGDPINFDARPPVRYDTKKTVAAKAAL
jgi:arylsulfatase A-like enzyme